MIVNNSSLKPENEKFLINWSLKKMLVLRILYIILGLFCFGVVIYKFINENVIDLTYIIVGIFFIFFVLYSKVMVKKMFRKNSYLDVKYHYQFEADKIVISAKMENSSGTTEFKYDFFDFYYVTDDAIYLKAKAKKYFYIVNNDGYETGSVEDLVKLLEGKVTKK